MGGTEARVDVVELEQLLRAADPAALLVRPRLLRRVIKEDRALGGVGLQVPHRKSWLIARDRLLAIASRAELDVPDSLELPAQLILLNRPDPDRLADLPRAQVLQKGWRLLFHINVHR